MEEACFYNVRMHSEEIDLLTIETNYFRGNQKFIFSERVTTGIKFFRSLLMDSS